MTFQGVAGLLGAGAVVAAGSAAAHPPEQPSVLSTFEQLRAAEGHAPCEPEVPCEDPASSLILSPASAAVVTRVAVGLANTESRSRFVPGIRRGVRFYAQMPARLSARVVIMRIRV